MMNGYRSFLKNVWVFDHIQTTAEDKKRTKMYSENVQREKYREQVPFID